MLSVAFPGDPEDLNKRDGVDGAARFDVVDAALGLAANRVCDAADLINWCALFTNPDRISQTGRAGPALRRWPRAARPDRGLRHHPGPASQRPRLWKEASPEVLEARSSRSRVFLNASRCGRWAR